MSIWEEHVLDPAGKERWRYGQRLDGRLRPEDIKGDCCVMKAKKALCSPAILSQRGASFEPSCSTGAVSQSLRASKLQGSNEIRRNAHRRGLWTFSECMGLHEWRVDFHPPRRGVRWHCICALVESLQREVGCAPVGQSWPRQVDLDAPLSWLGRMGLIRGVGVQTRQNSNSYGSRRKEERESAVDKGEVIMSSPFRRSRESYACARPLTHTFCLSNQSQSVEAPCVSWCKSNR